MNNVTERIFRIKIAGPKFEYKKFKIEDPIISGREIIELYAMNNIEEHLVFYVLKNGGLEELRLKEKVDISKKGIERFFVFNSSASYRIEIDGTRYEWGATCVDLQTLGAITGRDIERYAFFQEIKETADIRLTEEIQIDVSQTGLERFYSEQCTFTIIVKGRQREVEKKVLSFSELISLAYEQPPTGENICFSVSFRNGPSKRVEGLLTEGHSIEIQDGMVFNVSHTDKS